MCGVLCNQLLFPYLVPQTPPLSYMIIREANDGSVNFLVTANVNLVLLTICYNLSKRN